MLTLQPGEDAEVVHRCGFVAYVRRLVNGFYVRPAEGGMILTCCPDCGARIDEGTILEEWQRVRPGGRVIH